MIYFIVTLVGVFIGAAVVVMVVRLRQSSIRRQANLQAAELIQEAEEAAKELIETSRLAFEDFEAEAKNQHEAQMIVPQKRIQDLQAKIEEVEAEKQDQLQKVERRLHQLESNVQKQNQATDYASKRFETSRSKFREQQKQWAEALLQKNQTTRPEYLKSLAADIISQAQIESAKQTAFREEDFQMNVEKYARASLQTVLGRFARPYCAERGIKNINFPNVEVMNRCSGKEQEHLRLVEELVGVDLTLHDDRLFLNVSAFDPVRRELTRMIFDRLMNERDIDASKIRKFVSRCHQELMKRLFQDGNRASQELKLQNLHPETRSMIGALRYRYSFAQNQYFHVGEVGWLCGLLAAEIGVSASDARRSGLLHDIGKAMDHSIEGGHAVIGADFIEKHGEKQEVVHAVRAHHFDEHPSTELAYLVIGADALSGARPGARRSTADSYSQKMEDLTRVSQSFDGVISSYIVSAGREIRVIVDSHRINDMAALELSKQMAQKIEEECSYPGQIRVTVVRETQAVEYAK